MSRPDGKDVRVTVAGEIDLLTVDQLRAGLLSVPAAHATVIELDLSGVSFLDCSGIGALITIRRDAADFGTRVTIVAASAAVLRVLTVFDLDVAFGYRLPNSPAARHRWWQRPTLGRRPSAATQR